jgi:hypothetical protein
VPKNETSKPEEWITVPRNDTPVEEPLPQPPSPPEPRERGPYWETGPAAPIPFTPETNAPAETVGLNNATLFRAMGPEHVANPDYQSNSWSNSANGQNKQEINGAPDNKNAPDG